MRSLRAASLMLGLQAVLYWALVFALYVEDGVLDNAAQTRDLYLWVAAFSIGLLLLHQFSRRWPWVVHGSVPALGATSNLGVLGLALALVIGLAASAVVVGDLLVRLDRRFEASSR